MVEVQGMPGELKLKLFISDNYIYLELTTDKMTPPMKFGVKTHENNTSKNPATTITRGRVSIP